MTSSAQTLHLYDNSRLSDFRRSPRLYYFRHIRGWSTVGKPNTQITGGLAFHSALDVAYPLLADGQTDLTSIWEASWQAFCQTWTNAGLPDPEDLSPEQSNDLQPNSPLTYGQLLISYIKARRAFIQQSEILAIEQPFIVPLSPTDPTLFYIGRIDKILRHRGKTFPLDHKTTSWYAGRAPNIHFRDQWLDGWSGDPQIDGYLYACRLIYTKKITSLRIDGILVHPTAHETFCLLPIERQESHLDNWLWTTHYTIQEIERNLDALLDLRSKGKASTLPYLPTFPCTQKNCNIFSGCPFRYLCLGRANPETYDNPPPGYNYNPWEPFDQSEVQAALGSLSASSS